jgi:hypothetical protein
MAGGVAASPATVSAMASSGRPTSAPGNVGALGAGVDSWATAGPAATPISSEIDRLREKKCAELGGAPPPGSRRRGTERRPPNYWVGRPQAGAPGSNARARIDNW